MSPILSSILTLIQYAPAAITEITALYNSIKGDLSASDQTTIDEALAAAQAADAAATATADDALDTASKQ